MIDSKNVSIYRATGSFKTGKIQFDTNTQNKKAGAPPGTGNGLTFGFGLA